MALILPLCRLLLVAQNVWATYHVLKAPRISRTTGQPSQRALAARKRAMKSCLAVWLVWACIWLAEGPLDSTVGIVMPFYSEAKSLVTLGLLVFKSYAAEPIVLHVIRPAVKPYMGTIDGILELFSLVAGLVANVLRMPWLAARAWWNAPASASATSSSNSGSSSDDGYARRVALGDADNRAALHDAHRRANAVFQQLDDAQRRHRVQSQSRERERPAPPTTRHSRNSSSSSSVPPAPGAWSYTNGPRPSSRTSHYPPARQPSATYAAAQQYPSSSSSRQPSATYAQQAAAPRPPSRTSHYASQPQPVAGPSTRRSSSGTGAPNPNPNANPYEIWYPSVPVPNRAPSPGSQSTQAFFYPHLNPQAAQQVSTPPPPYESVRQRTVPDTPHRFPGALPFLTPAPAPSFPVPQRGFEDAPGDANPIAGGDGRPPHLAPAQEARDFIDLTAEGSPPPPPPPIVEKRKEKALPSPPPDEEEVMEIDSLPLPLPAPKTRTRARTTTTTRKRAHDPEPPGAAADEELSDAGTDTTSSSVVKKRRVAGGRVARRVAMLDSEAVREQPTTTNRKTKTASAPPPKPARLNSTGSSSAKEKIVEKPAPSVPAQNQNQKKSLLARVAPALAHQAAPPPAPVSLSASTSTRTTRSSSRTVDATGVQGMAALDAAATSKRRSRR